MSTAISATARGATFMILVQISSRALTFLANQLLLRFLSPALLGAATQLELYSISVLYFARESLRVALQRQSSNAQAVVNVSHIPIVLGVPLAYGLGVLYLGKSAGAGDVGLAYLHAAVALYALASLVELASEPSFVVMQMKMQYKVRAAAETGATIARCLTTFVIVVGASRQGVEVGVLPFACGQLAYASVLLVVYLWNSSRAARKDGFKLIPAAISKSKPEEPANILNLFPQPIIHLGLNLYFQTAIKYILTQGDSLLMFYLTTLSTQGAYALASNYGGLIARMLFQPLEDTSRNLFAKLCSSSTTTTTSKDGTTASSSPSRTNLAQAALFLTTLLRFYALLSLFFFALGPPLSPHLLALIAGTRWTSTGAGTVLATYCYYIPLLALNGVTEAFVAATASTSELRTQSAMMTGWFVAFAGVAYVLLGPMNMGAEGLVWANVVNMSLRIVWNVRFVQTFFGRFGADLKLQAALPELGSVAASVGVGAILRARMKESVVGEGVLGQLVRGGGVAVVLVAIVATSERRFLLGVYAMVKGMSAKEEKQVTQETKAEKKSD